VDGLLTGSQRLAKQGKIANSRASFEAFGSLMPILAMFASAVHLP
jgi:hypothetical protein